MPIGSWAMTTQSVLEQEYNKKNFGRTIGGHANVIT